MADAESTELKGGHAPAVKAGGMRVTQNKPPKVGDSAPEPTDVEQDEGEEQQVAQKEKTPSLVVAGFETQGDKDFPPAAVKSYHDKPTPTHDKRPANSPMKQQINQPRKQ